MTLYDTGLFHAMRFYRPFTIQGIFPASIYLVPTAILHCMHVFDFHRKTCRTHFFARSK